MIHALAILGEDIVIIHNDSTACRFETKSVYTPLRGYYDQQFQYTLIRRSQLRTADSIARTESKYLAFDGMIGVSINAQGEVYSHTLATESTPNGVDCEQVAEFQGMAGTMGDVWFANDNYIANTLSLLWEQTGKLEATALFAVLEPTRGSSVSLTMSTIKVNAFLKSIDMFNRGMITDVSKMWNIQQFERDVTMKEFDINNTQEFNASNLAMITTYHNVADDVTS